MLGHFQGSEVLRSGLSSVYILLFSQSDSTVGWPTSSSRSFEAHDSNPIPLPTMAMQNPAQSRNPDGTPFAHESQPGGPLLRLVLVYPAMLDAPFLVPMEFSATGSEAKRHGDTVAIDLAGRYGAHGRETYFKSFEPDPSPDEYLVYSDEYLVYFNMSRRLPRNAALCKVLGVDPQRPGARPMFRGDVVVATSKTNDAWEGLSATYTERTYFDFPAANMAFVGELIKRWYQSTAWAEMRFKDEQDYELPPGAIPPTWDWRNPTHIPGFAYDAYDDEERGCPRCAR
ncbi:hypothetical protein FB451DRAFT_1245924 [Mycena latifolia]|nr:hypothetical protein FB451DRAFT_1245924 [Mycena latifolia]